ncbi:uncharacterized protein LOC119069673 [Bradysia coprophila]|uniref:uncharacterized protein LOC119069673 n=1 Tax=Bradysia coprophila TaxID=38358 RepID=UPI00187DC87E|nr:uncharacterized protein LOC119069673 [Bradysia coprophila]
MGYDIDRFVNLSPDIADHFKCAVCLDIYEAPLELPCGHIYCLECIRRYFNNRNTIECPECRARIEFREVKPPNRKLLGLLHNLTIKCEFVSKGCNEIVKVENLLAHTGECRFNRTSTRSRRYMPRSEGIARSEDLDFDLLLDSIFSGDLNDFDRRQQLQMILNEHARAIEQISGNHRQSSVSLNEESSDNSNDYELLINDEGIGRRICGWITRNLCRVFCRFFIALSLAIFLVAAPIAAIVISALKLKSCNQITTLPPALMALGISMFLSVILETVRRCYYSDKFCAGLKFIQSFAISSVIYLAIVVYSNLDYNVKAITGSPTLTCDALVFEFSFWFISTIFAFCIVVSIALILYLIYKNLCNIWSEWDGSYILLTFIYAIPIVGIIMSITTLIISYIYFDSCAAIPRLTTNLDAFGAFGLACWLNMLYSRNFKNCCVWMFVLGLLVAFICLAVVVSQNFPWQFSSQVQRVSIECDMTIYTYAFVTVCINYVIIGLAILMYSIYGGICTCLFFT